MGDHTATRKRTILKASRWGLLFVSSLTSPSFWDRLQLALNRFYIGGKKSRIKETGCVTMDGNSKWGDQKSYANSPLPVSDPEQRGVNGQRRRCLALPLVKSKWVRDTVHPSLSVNPFDTNRS